MRSKVALPPQWRIVKGNIFKDGRIILTRLGGTPDRRIPHHDLVTALDIYRKQSAPSSGHGEEDEPGAAT